MSHPDLINGIIETTTIPVMAKARIGHDEEARVLEALGVDMVDESEVLTPADPFYHIAKNDFTIPFVCGCTNLGEAARSKQTAIAFEREWEIWRHLRPMVEILTGVPECPVLQGMTAPVS